MDKIKEFFVMCLENYIQMVTSAITIEEYFVFPYTNGNMKLVDNFKRFINYANIEIIDINSEIAEQSTIIRNKFKYFKAMDVLQIATAKVSECDMFFTK